MDASTIEQALASQALLSGLDPKALAFLARHAEQRQIERDETLFRHDDQAQHFYLLQQGRVSIEVAALEGPPLVLQQLGPGKILGWSWLIPPYRWHFQARAEAPCTVIEFDGAAILAHCEDDPAFGYALFKRFSELMSRRLEYAREKMMDAWSPPGFA